MSVISKEHLIDYKKYKITNRAAILIQNISIVPIFLTLYEKHIQGQNGSDHKARDQKVSVVGSLLNVCLCSGALAAGLSMLYKAHKINLGTTIGVSIAFPLLWIASAIIGYVVTGVATTDRDLCSKLNDLTYFNPLFAFTVLPATMLMDTAVNSAKECFSKGAAKE